jgi:hypothetical protein
VPTRPSKPPISILHKNNLRSSLTKKFSMVATATSPAQWMTRVLGTIECRDFTTMINVQRLLCDLDSDLSTTEQTGGISETISISRCKERFGKPTTSHRLFRGRRRKAHLRVAAGPQPNVHGAETDGGTRDVLHLPNGSGIAGNES